MSPSATLQQLVSELTTSLQQTEAEMQAVMREAFLYGLTPEKEVRLAKLIGRADSLCYIMGRIPAKARNVPNLRVHRGDSCGSGEPTAKLRVV